MYNVLKELRIEYVYTNSQCIDLMLILIVQYIISSCGSVCVCMCLLESFSEMQGHCILMLTPKNYITMSHIHVLVLVVCFEL